MPSYGRPDPGEYHAYYATYMDLVPEVDILPLLQQQGNEFVAFLKSIPEAELGKTHLTYTWTIRQVLGHLLDGERVFGFRAYHVARADSNPMPGFDELAYVEVGQYNRMDFASAIEEFSSLRKSHYLMLQALLPEDWTRMGVVNSYQTSVKALAYILAGHVRHHGEILKKRIDSVR
jgi:hypothetical protein